MQIKGIMKVKGPTEVKGAPEVNFKHGGGQNFFPPLFHFQNDGATVSILVLLQIQLAILCF